MHVFNKIDLSDFMKKNPTFDLPGPGHVFACTNVREKIVDQIHYDSTSVFAPKTMNPFMTGGYVRPKIDVVVDKNDKPLLTFRYGEISVILSEAMPSITESYPGHAPPSATLNNEFENLL